MSDRIPAPTSQTPPSTPRTEQTPAPKVASTGVKPETLANFSPAEREAAEQMLAAYRTAIGRNRQV